MADTTVRAAGAVLWQRETPDDEPRVAVVHRPRYDDWSLPKGKVDPGEIPLVTAVREVAEETGYDCVLGRSLGSTTYPVTRGRTKHVDYWSARVTGGDFVANDEVDRMVWVSPAQARDTVSYDADREVLARFVHGPHPTSHAVLVRHARAGSKARYRGDDAERPLDSVGVQQAEALVPVLTAFGGTAVFSAERTRCVQTVAPWARSVGLQVVPERALTEETYARDPDVVRRRVRDIVATTPGVPVMCSQGKVIPPLMEWWAEQDGLTLTRTRSRKASVWLLGFVGGVLVTADHLESPLPASVRDD